MGEPGDALAVLAQILEFGGGTLGSGADLDSCPCYPQAVDWDCTTADGTAVVGWGSCSYGSGGAGGCTGHAFGEFRDDGDARYDILEDGSAGHGEAHSNSFVDYRRAIAHHGVHDEGFNGTSIRDGWLSTVNGWAVADAFYLMVIADDSLPTGDLCLDATLENVATCPDEPVGILRVVGAQEVTITYDGDVACDGCGSVAVDGVAAGEICDAIPKDWVGQ